MIFTILYERRFFKDLDRIPDADVERILAAVKELAHNPIPHGCKKLMAEEDLYRIRQGRYRVIYQIDRARIQIKILCARHRRDVYKSIP